MEIREDLVPFLTSGVSLLVGTRDAENVPACLRAMGVSIPADRRAFTVYVPLSTGRRSLANLAHNGRIAVTFSRVIDLRGVQMKGHVVGMRPSRPDEEALQRTYADAFCTALEEVGMPRATGSRMAYWPSMAVEVCPESIFEQTPGPAAGRVLDASAQP